MHARAVRRSRLAASRKAWRLLWTRRSGERGKNSSAERSQRQSKSTSSHEQRMVCSPRSWRLERERRSRMVERESRGQGEGHQNACWINLWNMCRKRFRASRGEPGTKVQGTRRVSGKRCPRREPLPCYLSRPRLSTGEHVIRQVPRLLGTAAQLGCDASRRRASIHSGAADWSPHLGEAAKRSVAKKLGRDERPCLPTCACALRTSRRRNMLGTTLRSDAESQWVLPDPRLVRMLCPQEVACSPNGVCRRLQARGSRGRRQGGMESHQIKGEVGGPRAAEALPWLHSQSARRKSEQRCASTGGLVADRRVQETQRLQPQKGALHGVRHVLVRYPVRLDIRRTHW